MSGRAARTIEPIFTLSGSSNLGAQDAWSGGIESMNEIRRLVAATMRSDCVCSSERAQRALEACLNVLLGSTTRVRVRELNGAVNHNADGGSERQRLVARFAGVCCELAFATHRGTEKRLANPEAALGPQRESRPRVLYQVGTEVICDCLRANWAGSADSEQLIENPALRWCEAR
jgi:hypothetical protein